MGMAELWESRSLHSGHNIYKSPLIGFVYE